MQFLLSELTAPLRQHRRHLVSPTNHRTHDIHELTIGRSQGSQNGSHDVCILLSTASTPKTSGMQQTARFPCCILQDTFHKRISWGLCFNPIFFILVLKSQYAEALLAVLVGPPFFLACVTCKVCQHILTLAFPS
jgi:hypothetical protein